MTSTVGRGGMGEVWKARDTRLGRDVAIKVLPAQFSQDADRRARFAREARALASLNHTNIASIYGIEERADGSGRTELALVMELVEGETLADRVARGPVPFDEAMALAHQIADALEVAHETRAAWTPWIAGASVVLAIAAAVAWSFATRPSPEPSLAVRFDIDLDQGSSSTYFYGPNAVLSPDGARMVLVAEGPDGVPRLYTRRLDERASVALPGTEGAHSPFVSPSGRWVGFFARSSLKRVAVEGGTALTVAEVANPRGGSWDGDEAIVVAGSTNRLMRVAASGGELQSLTDFANGEVSHRWPQVLQGGRGVLFTATATAVNFDNASMMAVSPGARLGKLLVKGATFGRYVASGHLLYFRRGTLFAQILDLDTLETDGREIPVLEDVAYSNLNGGGQVDVALTGAAIVLRRAVASTGRCQVLATGISG